MYALHALTTLQVILIVALSAGGGVLAGAGGLVLYVLWSAPVPAARPKGVVRRVRKP